MSQGKVVIYLWFDRGKAREAAEFYTGIFPDSRIDSVLHSPCDYPGGNVGDELTVAFTVLGMPFVGLNGGPAVTFNEAVSIQVITEDQAETDRYWNALVDNNGQEKPCSWCQDRYGLRWQITPRALIDALADADAAAARRAMQAMFEMTKIDIATIERARAGT